MAQHAGISLEQIEKLAGKAADVALTRQRIRLDERKSRDLHEYLGDLGLRMAGDFDPTVG